MATDTRQIVNDLVGWHEKGCCKAVGLVLDQLGPGFGVRVKE